MEPLSDYTSTKKEQWRAVISNPHTKSKSLKHITPHSSLDGFSESPLDDDTIHLVIFFSWKEVAFNYLLFHQNRLWVIQQINPPVNRVLQECLGRVNKLLLEMEAMADSNSIEFYKVADVLPYLAVSKGLVNLWNLT